MNIKFAISIFFNIIFIIYILYQALPFFDKIITHILSMEPSSISAFAATMSAIAASLSFIIALANFHELKKNNEKENDKYLYRKIILENHNQILNDFYNNAITNFDSLFQYLQRDPAAILAIERFSKEYSKRQNILQYYLIDYIGEIDNTLANTIKNVLDENKKELLDLLHKSFNMDDPNDSGPGDYDRLQIQNDFELLLAKQRRQIVHHLLAHKV